MRYITPDVFEYIFIIIIPHNNQILIKEKAFS